MTKESYSYYSKNHALEIGGIQSFDNNVSWFKASETLTTLKEGGKSKKHEYSMNGKLTVGAFVYKLFLEIFYRKIIK